MNALCVRWATGQRGRWTAGCGGWGSPPCGLAGRKLSLRGAGRVPTRALTVSQVVCRLNRARVAETGGGVVAPVAGLGVCCDFGVRGVSGGKEGREPGAGALGDLGLARVGLRDG